MKLNYINLNLAAIILFSAGLFLDRSIEFPYLLNIAGLSYLLFVVPFTILQLFKADFFSPIEKYFSSLVIFFFLYVPAFFFLNHWFGTRINLQNIIIANVGIFISVLVFRRFSRGDDIALSLKALLKKRNRLVIAAGILFVFLHVANYHFYRFMPEWDGYTDLMKISASIEAGDVAQTQRGFFYAATLILSTFSRVSPYALFTVVFIGLQTTLLLALFRLIRLNDVQSKSLEAILYLLALSVPVINMEVDMTRPQNIAIIFLPVLLYFLYRLFTEKKLIYGFLVVAILLFGLNYHEFFIFPALIYFGWFVLSHLAKAVSNSTERKDRIISTLILFCSILLAVLALGRMRSAGLVAGTFSAIVTQIFMVSEWKIWFLGQYASDGETLQMGWPGISGALKYYAYYLSPALALIFSLLVYFLVKSRKSTFSDPLLRIILPLFLVLFSFAEILPRINFLYLPERFWLFMDILLIFSFIPIFRKLSKKTSRITLSSMLILCIVGLSGSFYVASGKKALTSEREYEAALWIKENTPQQATFITQSANLPMIQFFAGRAILPFDSEYFAAEEVLEQNPKKEIQKLKSGLEQNTSNVTTLVDQFTSNKITFLDFADAIQKEKAMMIEANRMIGRWENSLSQPKYVVYSFDKFDTIYKERQWWLYMNAYGTNIEKFDIYPLVYSDGTVYIWKVR